MYIVKVLKSFSYAFRGIFFLFKTERNARIQLVIFLFGILLGFVFKITVTEWLVILVFGALVMALEALNTAIENLCDVVSPELKNSIKNVKDVSAGAVLIASIGAALAGIFIFWPYLINLL